MSKRFFETHNGIKGGMLKGKAHYDSNGKPLGGIKAIVTDQGGVPVELESSEVIVNKKTVQSNKVLTVKGTPKQILSTLNQMDGNGVAIGDSEAEILAKYREGGLIKRADGSYSKRGLWDNIRDNIGSGKKPTKQMLEQEAKIKNKYHLGGDMSKHLAPNGKPSNLTHEQWHLVRTPEFKAWFGDWENDPENASKVVDDNGEPLVVYHGTNVEFYKFDLKYFGKTDKGWYGKGFYFTPNKNFTFAKDAVEQFGGTEITLKVFLNIKNVLYGNAYAEQNSNLIGSAKDREKDGVIVKYDYGHEKEGKIAEIIVWNPNQIKLADGTNTTFDANNDDIRFKTGGEISQMTPSEQKAFYATDEGKKLDAETYAEWKRLVNMTKSELEDFYHSEEGLGAGLSRSEASKHGIDSGRESAEWIMKMKDIPYKEWTSDMWRWAKKQISFIKRMSGVKGELYDDKGRKTRKHTALLIWGHNPEKKFEGGGEVVEDEKIQSIIEGLKILLEYSKGKEKTELKKTIEGLEILLDAEKSNTDMLLAPNGKESNLTPEQYKIVRTDAFKKWFGDWEKAYKTDNYDNVSKVIDKDTKEPLVVYNGSKVDFYEFDKSRIKDNVKWGKGFYFTDDFEYAKSYANSLFSKDKNRNPRAFFLKINDEIEIHKNLSRTEYVALEPNQIKLADGTNTTFDINNNDIRFEGGGSIENEEMEETVIEHFKPYKSVEELAELHRVPVSEILEQLHIGEKTEMEHTTDYEIARIIALQHIEESPKYYTLLENMEEKFEIGGQINPIESNKIEFKPITIPL
jgi:hypothetical protein